MARRRKKQQNMLYILTRSLIGIIFVIILILILIGFGTGAGTNTPSPTGSISATPSSYTIDQIRMIEMGGADTLNLTPISN